MNKLYRAAMALALTVCAAANAQTRIPDISVETLSLGGYAELVVDCDQKYSLVYLDYLRRGYVKQEIKGLNPGTHVLTLQKDGYYDQTITLNLAPNTRTTVYAHMELKTGFLSVQAEPAWAEVVVDGQSYKQGILILPAGMRSVRIQAFGYESKDYDVFIPEKLMVNLGAQLDRAPFSLSGFDISQTRFNPRNSGTKGAVTLSFRVSAPGRGTARVMTSEGGIVREWKLGPFTDWYQEVPWDGRDDKGAFMPDGHYDFVLELKPEPGIESDRDIHEAQGTVTVDSSLIVTPRGKFSAIPGAELSPDPFEAPVSSLSLGLGALFAGNSGGVKGGVELYAALSLEKLFDLGFGLRAWASEEPGTGFAAIRRAFPLPSPLGAAFSLDGGISEGSERSPSWVRASLPVGIGGRFLNLSVSPDLGWYWEGDGVPRAGCGLALSASGYALGGALSARARSGDLRNGLAPAWPVEAAAELRILPPGFPLSFILNAALGFDPMPSAWRVGILMTGGL